METSDGSPVWNTKQFTATVTNTTNTAVTWQVNGIPGGNSIYGQISNTGLYTAPLLVPTEPVVVKAVSAADPTKSASASVTLSWNIRNIGISMINAGPAVVRANEDMPLDATVDTYANEKGVTWTINGSPQGNANIGTITPAPWWNSGLEYVAPVTVSSQFTVTLTATAKANPTKSKDFVITVTPGDPGDPVLTISPTQAAVPAAGKQQFAAFVDGQAVNASWSVNGTMNPPITDGRMQNGLYTAPFEVPASGQVVVMASISSTRIKCASAVVTITPPATDPNSRVKGDYAFQVTDEGHHSNLLGKITADGAGHLSGIADINTAQGQALNYAFNGTYKIGLDGRGTASVKLPTTQGGTIDATFHLMLLSDNYAYLYEMDSAGTGTGFIEKQDPAAYATSAITGTFAFLLNGTGHEIPQPPTKQAYSLAIAGYMVPNGMGGVDGGEVDWVGKAGAHNDVVLASDSSYTIGADGRGTATLRIAGTLSHFSVVVISANKVLLSSNDDVTPLTSTLPLLIGTAEKQLPNLTINSFAGPYVYYARGDMYVQMGRFVNDPTADLPSIVDGVLDERGQLTSGTLMNLKQSVPVTGTYGFGNGRLWFNMARYEAGNYIYQPVYAYPVSPDKFYFVMDGVPQSAGAVSGVGYAQHGITFDDSTISGMYGFQMVASLDLGTGWFDRQPDYQPYSFADIQQQSAIPMSWQIYPPESNGIGRMEISAYPVTLNWSSMRYYIVSKSKVLFMGLGPDDSYIGNDLGWIDAVQ